MAFSFVKKNPGDLIQSADWNAAMVEIDRLEKEKLNKAGGEINGNLSIAGSSSAPVEKPGLTIKNNGTNAWGNALSIDQTQQGNSAGPKIRFQRTGLDPISWSAGILNGANAKQFAILEDTSGGPGSVRLVVAQGGNVGLGVNDPKAKLHISGGNWDLSNTEGDLVIGTAALRLKIGVATEGGGAGDVRIRAHGGTNRLFIGVKTSDVLAVSVGSLTISADSSVKFDNRLRQVLTLWDNGMYGVGIQDKTMYFRSEFHFAWYKRGLHNDTSLNPGNGGDTLMKLEQNGALTVSGLLIANGGIEIKGTAKINGKLIPTGADYAETFESEKDCEIPDGTSVIIGDNGFIRPAKTNEIPIGVISATSGIIGNCPIEWPEKFVTDDYGNLKLEYVEEAEPVSEEAENEWMNLIQNGMPISAEDRRRLFKNVNRTRPILSPKYDESRNYIPRTERPEWHKVGLLGQIRITKGQPTAPTWVKIKDISENAELWLVK